MCNMKRVSREALRGETLKLLWSLTLRFKMNLLSYSLPRSSFGTVNTRLKKACWHL